MDYKFIGRNIRLTVVRQWQCYSAAVCHNHENIRSCSREKTLQKTLESHHDTSQLVEDRVFKTKIRWRLLSKHQCGFAYSMLWM